MQCRYGKLDILDVGKEKGLVSILSLIPSRYLLAICNKQ
jgi:hypothetical protein